MGKIKILEYSCGLSVVLVGLGLYSYYVRELMASLVLFGAFFFSAGLLIVSVFLLWGATKRAALWGSTTARSTLALAFGTEAAVSAMTPKTRA